MSDFYNYSRNINLGVEFLPGEIHIFHNDEAVHMIPAALNLIHNFALKWKKMNESAITTTVSFKFILKVRERLKNDAKVSLIENEGKKEIKILNLFLGTILHIAENSKMFVGNDTGFQRNSNVILFHSSFERRNFRG